MHWLESVIARKVSKTIKKSRVTCVNKIVKDKVKILVIGYSGKRNTGAEARCAEIINNLQKKFGNKIQLGLLSVNPSFSQDYYPDDVELIPLSSIFFKDLLSACSAYDIGILAEGSCLTSVTSNVAALYFICAAGIFKNQNKACFAYGVEAGPLPQKLQSYTRKYFNEVVFIARTKHSQEQCSKYGIKAEVGTDTAWSLRAASDTWVKSEVRKIIGDFSGKSLLTICPMNPYIRPITPSFSKFLRAKITGDWRAHYDKIYFYTIDKERLKKYDAYIEAFSNAIQYAVDHFDMYPIFFAMEPMDLPTIADIRKKCFIKTAVVSSENYNAVQMAALLQQCDLQITSRYHAYVLSLRAAVPSIAVSKDQRLHTIFKEDGNESLCLSSESDELNIELPIAIKSAVTNQVAIRNNLRDRFAIYYQKQLAMDNMVHEQIANYVIANE